MDGAVLRLMFLCAFAGWGIGAGVIMLVVECVGEKTIFFHGVINVFIGLITAAKAVSFASSNF